MEKKYYGLYEVFDWGKVRINSGTLDEVKKARKYIEKREKFTYGKIKQNRIIELIKQSPT